jgi:cytochrome P450
MDEAGLGGEAVRSFAEIQAILRSRDADTACLRVAGENNGLSASMLTLPPDEHLRARRQLEKAMRRCLADPETPQAVLAFAQVAQDSVANTCDAVPAAAELFAARSLCWCLGLPDEASRVLASWAQLATSAQTDPRVLGRTNREMRSLLHDVPVTRDSAILHCLREAPPAERLFTVRALASGGIQTVRDGVVVLNAYLEQSTSLAGLDERQVSVEILRCYPPVPKTWRTIPARGLVELSIEDANEELGPMVCDPGGTGGPLRSLSFGSGAHRCPGERLAIVELESWMRVMLQHRA